MMNAEPLVITTREVASEVESTRESMQGEGRGDHASRAIGGGVENVHHGSIAVVSSDGQANAEREAVASVA